MNIDIQIPPDQLKQLQEDLDPRQFAKANYRIVKNTTAKVVSLIRKAVREQVTIDKKYVDRVITQIDPSGNPPVGKVVIRHSPIPLIAFRSRELGSGGVSIKVAKDLPPRRLRHGFYALVGKRSHEGIFLRSRHLPTKGSNVGGTETRISKVTGKPFTTRIKLTPRGIAGRLAIEEQFGPPIVNLVTIPDVLKRIEFDTLKYAVEQANSQLYRFTGVKIAAQESEEPAESAD